MVSYLAPQGFISPLASSRLTPLSETWALKIMCKDGHNDASKHTHQTLLYPCHFCLAGDAMGNSIMISISHMRKLRPRRASQQESSSGCGGGFKVETAPYLITIHCSAVHTSNTWASSCLLSLQEVVQLPPLSNSVSKLLSPGCSCLIMVSRRWAPEESKLRTTDLGSCTSMFIAALSTSASIWNQPSGPSTHTGVKKMWYIHS